MKQLFQALINRVAGNRQQADPASLPRSLQRLQDTLRDSDFVLVDSRYEPKHFGNILFEWEKGDLSVRFVFDRSEWHVDLGCVSWFSTLDWRDYFAGRIGPDQSLTIEQECAMVRKSLQKMLDALLTDFELVAKLKQLRSARVRASRPNWFQPNSENA